MDSLANSTSGSRAAAATCAEVITIVTIIIIITIIITIIVIIEQVVVRNPKVKWLRKGNTEENIFQRAAHMISSPIRVQRCAKEWSGK